MTNDKRAVVRMSQNKRQRQNRTIGNCKKWSVCRLNDIFPISSTLLVPAPAGTINILFEDNKETTTFYSLSTLPLDKCTQFLAHLLSLRQTQRLPFHPLHRQVAYQLSLSGTPNPSPLFATAFEFAVLAGGAVALFSSQFLLLTLLCCSFGASWTLGW